MLCLVVAALLALASSAFAGPSAGITVTVTLQSISVGVSPGSWAIGVITAGTLATSSTFTATNNGNVAEDFTISTVATSPDGWAPGGSSAVDQYWLQFGTTTIGTSPVALASNVAASGNSTFSLKFTAPATGSAATGQDSFTVTVAAAAH
jgi:hypothetical protein